MIFLRLATLTGTFALGEPQTVTSEVEARKLVEKHAASGGFTHVALIQEDICSARYTARTPGGRGGRNIAFIDYE